MADPVFSRNCWPSMVHFSRSGVKILVGFCFQWYKHAKLSSSGHDRWPAESQGRKKEGFVPYEPT